VPRPRRLSGINPARFHELLELDREQPNAVRWRERHSPDDPLMHASWNARFAGRLAGMHQAGQTTRIRIDGKSVDIREIIEALECLKDDDRNPAGMPGSDDWNDGAGPLAAILAAASRKTGLSPGKLTVLVLRNDPYRCAPAQRRNAEWFAEHWAAHDARHLRGLHYKLIGRALKPNGRQYSGAYKDFRWLQEASSAARWLGLISFDGFEDRRNGDPVIHRAERDGTELSAGVGADFNAEPPTVEVTEGETGEISIYPTLAGMTAEQPYILAVFGEKSSLDDELRPVAVETGADMYLETGEQSITHAYHIAERAAADGRPLIVLVVSDCDPSGYQMSVSIARKLQALRDLQFPTLDVDVIHVGLTPDQVRQFDLPSSPLSDNEKRAGRWTELMGVEQTELDSLLTLHPGALARMVREALSPYFDSTLDERVRAAERTWGTEARNVIGEGLAAVPDLAAKLAEIEARASDISARIEALADEAESVRAAAAQINAQDGTLAAEIADINAELAELASEIDLDLPDVPEPGLPDRPTDGPNMVLSSAWDWVTATRRLKARKAYDDNGDDW
jgi:hypothetical protein